MTITYTSGNKPVRGGQPECYVRVDEACFMGHVLGYSSGWKLALAATGSVVQGRLIALGVSTLDDEELGDTIPATRDAVVGGFTGLTPGGLVYVSETNAGEITQTIPTDSGDATTAIGIALSVTEILFFLNARADSVV